MRSETLRKERRMRRNNIIIGLILLFVMVFSMLGVYVNRADQQTNGMSYNGYNFKIENVQGGQMASTDVNGQKYYFYTLPVDAKRIIENLTGINEMGRATKIIFTNEPLGLNNQASSEQIYFDKLVLDMQTTSGKQIVSGLSAPDEFLDKQVYSCANASDSSVVVMFKKGIYQNINITEISNNCFEVKSDTSNILAFRDYLMYKSLGIIA
jgi:hypothetical protein